MIMRLRDPALLAPHMDDEVNQGMANSKVEAIEGIGPAYAEKKLTRRVPPPSMVADWVSQAKALPRKVEH